MVRLRGPENGSRQAFRLGGTPATLARAVLFAGSTGDARADVLYTDGSPVIAGEVVTDGYGFLPQIQFPDGATTVYVEVAGGERQAIYALPNYGEVAGIRDVLPVGRYVQPWPDSNGSYLADLNREFCFPFVLYDSGRLDRLAARVNAAGSAGAVFRIGIRANNGGLPSRTVLVEGTVDAATGDWKELVIDLPIAPGLMWLSLVGQAWTTTAPRFQTSQGGFGPHGAIGGSQTAPANWATGHGPTVAFQDSVVGTLADHPTAPMPAPVNLPIPLFAVRRSA